MRAHVVGGAVRDRLLNRPTLDFDVVVDKNPKKIADIIAKSFNGTAFPLDEERGIVRVALKSGIHADIAKIQGPTFEADIDRRDFTVNALSVPMEDWIKPNWKKFIIDRHKGIQHLSEQRIVPVSARIFKEDPLRLLRAFRISAELNFKLSPETLKMIARYKALIRKPAPERKRSEMLQIFATPNAYPTLLEMDKTGLLDKVFREAPRLRKTASAHYGKGGVLKHTLDSVRFFEEILRDKSWFPGLHGKIAGYLNDLIAGQPRYAHCKWALLLHDIGKPDTMKMMKGRLRFFEHEQVGADKVAKIANQFRWSSDEVSKYSRLVRNHMRPGNLAADPKVTDKAIHRFFRDLDDDAIAMLLVSLADHLTYLTPAQRKKRNSPHERVTIKMIRRYYTAREKVVPPRLVTGYDIMKTLHLKPSPLIGNLLKDLTEAQSEGSIHTKERALQYLKGRLAWHQGKIQND